MTKLFFFMFDKHKNNVVVFADFEQVKKIVVLLTLGKSKNIVILLTLCKSKKYCHFADFGQVTWMAFNL